MVACNAPNPPPPLPVWFLLFCFLVVVFFFFPRPLYVTGVVGQPIETSGFVRPRFLLPVLRYRPARVRASGWGRERGAVVYNFLVGCHTPIHALSSSFCSLIEAADSWPRSLRAHCLVSLFRLLFAVRWSTSPGATKRGKGGGGLETRKCRVLGSDYLSASFVHTWMTSICVIGRLAFVWVRSWWITGHGLKEFLFLPF